MLSGWAEAAAHKASQRWRVARGRAAAARRALAAAFLAWAGLQACRAKGVAKLQALTRARAEARLQGALREWAWLARWVVRLM